MKFSWLILRCLWIHFFNRDIQDLQRRNQTLLQVVRDLSEKKEEEESMAAEEK